MFRRVLRFRFKNGAVDIRALLPSSRMALSHKQFEFVSINRPCISLVVPTIENWEELYIRVCFSFFLFSTQNQLPQIIIGKG